MRIPFLLLALSSLHAEGHYQETLYPSWGQTFEITETIYQGKTETSEIVIFDNPLFGRVLAVDGSIRATEKDAFIYCEMLVHPPLIAHGKPSSVLIIGGEDGGALHEALRHKDVERAVLVTSDQSLIDWVKTRIPSLSQGAFDDARVEVIIQNPSLYIKEPSEPFDIILCDSCLPSLCTKEFYGQCKNKLKPGGILVNQEGSPFLQKERLKSSIAHRKAHFDNVTFYLSALPTRPGGFTAFGWASDVKHTAPLETLKKRLSKVDGKMKYYTTALHKSSFTLPEFMLPQAKKGSNQK